MKVTATIICTVLGLIASQTAVAYVGPGAGLSLLGALWGLLLAVGAALLFIVLWPLRRYLRRRAEARQAVAVDSDDNEVVSPPQRESRH